MNLLSLFKKTPVPQQEMTFVAPRTTTDWMRYTNADSSIDNALATYGYQVYKDMMADGVVKSCMLVKTYGVTVGGNSILPAVGEGEENYELAQEIADFVKWNLSEMTGSLETILADTVGPAMKNGFSVQEKVWQVLEKEPYKGKIGLKCVKLRPSETFTFDIDQYGNIVKLIQTVGGEIIEVPVDRMILFTYDPQQTGLPQGCSDLRAAYGPYKEKLAHRKWRSVAAEKFATPTVLGHYPPGTPTSKITEFLNVLKTFATDTALAVPTGMEVELLQANGSIMAPYTETIDSCNKEIARAIFGQVLATDEGKTGTGSYAQARIHEGILGMFFDSLRQDVSEALNEQLVKPLVDFNYQTSLYPRIKLAPPDKRDIIALARVIDTLTAHGYIKNTEPFVRQEFGFPPMPQDLMGVEQPPAPVGENEPTEEPQKIDAKAPRMAVEADDDAKMSGSYYKATPIGESTL